MRKYLKRQLRHALGIIGITCEHIRFICRKLYLRKMWTGMGILVQVIIAIVLLCFVVFQIACAIIIIPFTMFMWVVRFLLGTI